MLNTFLLPRDCLAHSTRNNEKMKLALIVNDILTSLSTILTDLSTSSTEVQDILELGGVRPPPPTTKDVPPLEPPPWELRVLAHR